MVKLYCNRCGREVADRYYTINIYDYDVYLGPDYATACCATGYSNTREGVLRMLNSTTMYCKDCVDKIERFIAGDGF